MILYFFQTVELGEAQLCLLAEIGRQRDVGIEGRALVPACEGELLEKLEAAGVPCDVIRMPARWFEFRSYLKKFFRYFRMYDFRLIHTDGARSGLWSVAVKVRFNTPLLWQFWTYMPPGIKGMFFRWAASVFCDHLIAGSVAHAHEFGKSSHWRHRISISGDRETLTQVYSRFVESEAPPNEPPNEKALQVG